MGEVSLDDIQLALVPVSKKSASVYKSVVILYKSIFRAAMESRIIDHNPTIYLTTKGAPPVHLSKPDDPLVEHRHLLLSDKSLGCGQ